MIHGVGRDAKYIAKVIKENSNNSSNILTAQVKEPTGFIVAIKNNKYEKANYNYFFCMHRHLHVIM
jgi:hypothetical protein